MSDYQQDLQKELEYLEKTLTFLRNEISKINGMLSSRKTSLKESRKDMWENGVHFTNDFDRLTEVNQYLTEVNIQTANYINTAIQAEKYKKMLNSPYFGRFDFIEDSSDYKERIYIGLHNAMNSSTHEILVYDWRAPISSIFYQYELGNAVYKAPCGEISGDVLLKRQYKIENSKLMYFLDSSIRINDDMLQEVLRRNSSAKMRNIVETIQKEQDIIIRDTENELLIVQGVAGSGKTSIALHRIAFLLYHGLNSNLTRKNILILSPNAVFGKYISSVLPELGEENVNQITFEGLTIDTLKQKGRVQTRSEYLEALMACKNPSKMQFKREITDFKGSKIFVKILDRFIAFYEHNIVKFNDVYYEGKIIETRERLKNLFLDNKINLPVAKRLKRIENIIMDKVQPLQKEKLKKLENIVEKTGGHEFEVKSFSRMLSIKESKAFLDRIKRFTEINYYSVYTLLFKEKNLFNKIAGDLELPDGIEHMLASTSKNLENGFISFEDCAPLLYLKLKLEDSDLFSDIKQVVIDEAQDYSPMHYEVFRLLFKEAGYTVLGDVNQSIEKDNDVSLYDDVVNILSKKKSVKVMLNKSFRSSFEISTFAQTLLNRKQDIVPFERHEIEPLIEFRDTLDDMHKAIIDDTKLYLKEGFGSVAIICKTAIESEKLYNILKDSISITLISTSSEEEIEKGITVIPSYMAKGLEFDVVLVFNVSEDNYSNEFDKRLLYIACTRALHRLTIYYTGTKSHFI